MQLIVIWQIKYTFQFSFKTDALHLVDSNLYNNTYCKIASIDINVTHHHILIVNCITNIHNWECFCYKLYFKNPRDNGNF